MSRRAPEARADVLDRAPARSGALARVTHWLMFSVVGPGAVLAGWCCWVWFSGRPWSHQPTRRYVTRPVRAVGNWLATALAVGLVVAPAATVAATGSALVALGLAVLVARWRWELRDRAWSLAEWLGWPAPRRDEFGRFAVRVKAHIDGEARR